MNLFPEGTRVRTTTGRTGRVEYHSTGYAGEADRYLVRLDVPYADGTSHEWSDRVGTVAVWR